MKTVIIDGVEKTFHEAHQELWNELSRNQGMTKDDYFESHDVSIYPQNECFACESCGRYCRQCPITAWRTLSVDSLDNVTCCYVDHCGSCEPSDFQLYGQWRDLMLNCRYAEACKIAVDIANLKWEEVEE